MFGRVGLVCVMTFAPIVLTACEVQPAPTDDAMIRTFRANRKEFEYWKTVFDRPEQNCRVELNIGMAFLTAAPCEVADRQRLSDFMNRTGVITIEARWESRNRDRKGGPIIFVMFAEGFRIGQVKQIDYNPTFVGNPVQNLDAYNWGRIAKDKPLPSGFWSRRIEGGWYLDYSAG
jgi:hypothetical protein